MLDTSLAYWARSTASEQSGLTTTNYITKTYLSQTPGFAWNVQCFSASISGASKAAELYKVKEPDFEAFFSSIRLTEPR
jgi:hypothetical protein